MRRYRRPIRFTNTPPTRTGWYAYSHCGEEFEVRYFDEEAITHSWARLNVMNAVGIPLGMDRFSRRLKKRERCRSYMQWHENMITPEAY